MLGDPFTGVGKCGANTLSVDEQVRVQRRGEMSNIIFDQLYPYLGAEGATYWAQLLMVDPV
ncbi:hypothetical protein BFN03_10065 [Rhodococcus sp. WMMA185]|nr:hypothetical protein BFN03_10065 [Rhodococcus sp. WMMA185]